MKNRPLLYFTVLALALLTAACGGDFDSTGTTAEKSSQVAHSESEKDWEALLALPADPLTLDVSLEQEAAVTDVLSYEGGTLTAYGSDGTIYTLEIPEGALDAPTQITMTPLSGLEGLPFGEGVPYMVELEPEGLRLADVAILTITPPEVIPVEQQVFIGYQGGEHEFSFAPPVLNSPTLQIMIAHFSGYGVQKGLLADTEPLRERLGGDIERRLQEIVARELGKLRQKALLGMSESEEDDKAMQELFAWVDKVFYEQVLKPRLDAAEESCAAGRLAMMTLLGYERQLLLLGFETSHLSEIAGLGFKVADKCLQEEYELCRDEHIIHRMIPVVLGLMRQSLLLGIEDTSGIEAAGWDLARKCFSFELELQSEIVGNTPDAWYYESEMSSMVKLGFDDIGDLESGEGIHGEAPLVNERFFARSNNDACVVTSSSRGGSTLRISQLSWVVDFRDKDDKLGYVKDISMVISPEPTTESFRGRCGPSAFTADNSNSWSGAWGSIHQQACLPNSSAGSGGDSNTAQVFTPEDIAKIEAFFQQTGMSQAEIQELVAGITQGDGAIPPEVLSSILGDSSSSSSGEPAVQYGLGACQSETEWEVKAGEVFAIKEIDLSYGPLGATEKGDYTLRHTPQ